MDAVLLAASLSGQEGESLAEAGSGAGAALLCAAHRLRGCSFTGFERDPASIELASKGVAANGFAQCVDIRQQDVAERPSALENVYDQSFSNPPFFEPGAVRAPAPERQAAYIAETSLKSWILFLHHITKPGGRITLVHRAAALADLLELLNSRAGEIEVLPIRPAPGAQAGRILVRARKGLRRGPVTLYDGLALHEAAGGPYSARAAACFEGGALEWS
jgi:tRNA1(Val) A37 N6-methylase TrmN6